jgi:hypothetical protein
VQTDEDIPTDDNFITNMDTVHGKFSWRYFCYSSRYVKHKQSKKEDIITLLIDDNDY